MRHNRCRAIVPAQRGRNMNDPKCSLNARKPTGDTSSAISSAVTKFRAEGIDHVIVQDGPAGVFGDTGLTLEWMNQAKSQRWYPRYGQNASNAPGWSVLPSDQMDHAIAIDYSMLPGFKTAFREDWMGIWATGLVIAGTTSVWRAMFHWLGSNEGDAPEVRHSAERPRRIAA